MADEGKEGQQPVVDTNPSFRRRMGSMFGLGGKTTVAQRELTPQERITAAQAKITAANKTNEETIHMLKQSSDSLTETEAGTRDLINGLKKMPDTDK